VAHRKDKPLSAAEIGVKVGCIVNKYKVGKHIALTITDGCLTWSRKQANIDREKRLDGIYIVRTSEPDETLSAADAVRAYKRLGNVEKAFRTFKGIDLRIRPINHRLEDRVRSHILLCMLAYYVEWHMRQALASLLYADEDLETNRNEREPVAKALPSPAVRRKRATKESTDGLPLRRWDGLINALSTMVRNTCRVGEGKTTVRFTRATEPNAYQSRIFALLKEDGPAWTSKDKQLCPVDGTPKN
jgi:hypothetical protein